MEREQRKYDNAHMKGSPFKLGGDMKDFLSPFPPPPPFSLSFLCFLFVLSLYLQCSPSSPSFLSDS